MPTAAPQKPTPTKTCTAAPTQPGKLHATTRAALKANLQRLAIQRGNFILASGKKANVYVDCRNLSLDGSAVHQAGQALYQVIQPLHADAVAGVVLGAAPLVTATCIAASNQSQALTGCLIRKASKGHGTQKLVEGQLAPWMRVVLVEDVVTTGGSLLYGIDTLKALHPQLSIAGIISLVDRDAGGAELFAKHGIPYWPLFSLTELLDD